MRLSCPACDGGSFEELERVDVVEQHISYSPDDVDAQRLLTEAAAPTALVYQMLRCKKCALEFASPLKAPNSDWYAIAYRVLVLYPSERWEFGQVIKRIGSDERLFEVGCGSGTFLEKCRAAGVEAQGIDFIEESIRECVAKGLNASVERLGEESLRPTEKKFDHINAFHVLEHLDRPQILFERASSLAANGCHLWVSVPADQRPSRRFGTKDFLDQPPHHMSRWNPKAFAAIGTLTGWKLVEIIYEPMPLRAAVWSISVTSSSYKRQQVAGKFGSQWRERATRLALFPLAFAKRMTTERHLTGFSVLAHFQRK